MMLFKNTKVKVCSPDGDTDYFDIVVGVLQGDTLAQYLFIIYLDYVLRTPIDLMKENDFKLTTERSRRYLAHTIMDADCTDDIVLLTNTPTQAETLQHNLKQAAGGITSMSTQTKRSGPFKLVDKFTYLESNVSSTEKDINTWLAKAWTAIDRLLVIWKSDLTDKMKRSFFQAAIVSILLYGCTT